MVQHKARPAGPSPASGLPRRRPPTLPRRILETVDTHFPSVLSSLPPKHKLILASLLDATESLNLATDVLSFFLAIGWRTQVRMGVGPTNPIPTPPSAARVQPVQDQNTAADFATWTLHAHASYAPSPQAALQQIGQDDNSLLGANWESTADMPSAAYFMTINHTAGTIACTVRGSWSLDDAFISSMVAPAPFLGGLAHHGMLACARTLVQECGPKLRAAAVQFPHYRVVFTGHSMGAGVATLAGLILRNEALFLKEHGEHGQGPALVQHAYTSLRFEKSALGGSDVLGGPLPGTVGGGHFPRSTASHEHESPDAATSADASTNIALEHLEVFAIAPGPCMSLDLARACEGWAHSLVHGDDVTPRFNIAGMIAVKQELSNMQWASEVADLWVERAQSAAGRQAARLAGGALKGAWGAVKTVIAPPLRWSAAAKRALMGPSERDLFWGELEGPINMHSHVLARMQYYLPGCLFHLQYKYEHVPCAWDGSADASVFPLPYEGGVSIHDPYVALAATTQATARRPTQTGLQSGHMGSDLIARVTQASKSASGCGEAPGGKMDPPLAGPTPPPKVGLRALHPQLGELQDVRMLSVLPSAAFESPCDGGGKVLTPPQVRHYTPQELQGGAAAHQEHFCRVQWSGRMFMDHSTALTYKHLLHLMQPSDNETA